MIPRLLLTPAHRLIIKGHCPYCRLAKESCRLLQCPKQQRPRHKHWLTRLLEMTL